MITVLWCGTFSTVRWSIALCEDFIQEGERGARNLLGCVMVILLDLKLVVYKRLNVAGCFLK